MLVPYLLGSLWECILDHPQLGTSQGYKEITTYSGRQIGMWEALPGSAFASGTHT